MSTFITYNDFIASGLPVASDIREDEITFAIKTVERAFLKPLIGKELYASIIDTPASYKDLLDGNNFCNGLKHAECEMVFSWLLYDRMNLTRYTSVVKDDEYSAEPSEQDIKKLCQMHWESAIQTIIDTLESNELEIVFKNVPQPPFAELLFLCSKENWH